jgi:hypothetical protein
LPLSLKELTENPLSVNPVRKSSLPTSARRRAGADRNQRFLMIFLEFSKKSLDKTQNSVIILAVYFIKLISSYNVLQITKQISFYTILPQHAIMGAGGRRSWLKY